MGVVYEAYDPDLDRTVALKTISIAFAIAPTDREAFEQRFFGEARIAARLTHPGIIVVHDVGRDAASGTLYIAIERLQGRTVADLVARGQTVPWREALRIAKGVAEALHYAHSHKVVHLDVKPANVMVLPSGEPKLMDFGIAHIGTTGMKLTGSGEFFGTPLFMAPEQALGQEVDARADLFALGAILYAMVAGHHAFDAPNIAAILTRVIRADPMPPSQLMPGLPAAVDAIVARGLAKSRDSRYPDGQTMAEDIADALAGRSPRHCAGWTPGILQEVDTAPAPSLDTLAELDVDSLPDESAAAPASRPSHAQSGWDVEAALDRLGVPGPSGPDATGAESTREPEPPMATRRPAATTSTSGDVRAPDGSRAKLWGVGGGVALVLGVIAFVYVSRDRADSVPTTSSAPVPMASTGAPREATGRGGNAPAGGTREKRAVPPSLPSPAASAPATKVAFLAVDFEHPLRTGRLRLWVDDEKMFEDTLDGRVNKKILTLKLRKGVVTETLELTPGRHQIRVQVLWDDNERTETITGTFRAGLTRRLEVRLGRLRKDLSLDWK